jgi:hypothetical protein
MACATVTRQQVELVASLLRYEVISCVEVGRNDRLTPFFVSVRPDFSDGTLHSGSKPAAGSLGARRYLD